MQNLLLQVNGTQSITGHLQLIIMLLEISIISLDFYLYYFSKIEGINKLQFYNYLFFDLKTNKKINKCLLNR